MLQFLAIIFVFGTVFICPTNANDDDTNDDGSHKNVQVSLRAQFNQFPLIYEAAEYFNENELYTHFIDEFLKDFKGNKQVTDKNVHEWVTNKYMSLVSNTIGQTKIQSFELAMAIHYFTSKLAMFEQEWQSALNLCNAKEQNQEKSKNNESPLVVLPNMMCYFIGTNNKDFERVRNAIEQLSKQTEATIDTTTRNKLNVFDGMDHTFGDCSSKNNGKVVIFYGDYTNSKFKEMHQLLTDVSNENICYVLRPICLEHGSRNEKKDSNSNSNSNEGMLNMNGYGVELAIKNMEYKVLDDRKIEQMTVNADGSTVSEEEEKIVKKASSQVEIDPIVISTHSYLQKILMPFLESENEDATNKRPNILVLLIDSFVFFCFVLFCFCVF